VQFPKEAGSNKVESVEVKALGRTQQDMTILYPPQWVQCDLRYLDMTVLGQSGKVQIFWNNSTQNCMYEEIKRRLNLRNTWSYLV
jgi:hypothetical protein